MKYIKIAVSLLIVSTLWACPFDSDVDKAVRAIDKATTDLNRTSAGWQNIITQLGSDLPKDAHNLIANDVDMLARDVIGATSSSIMCTMDFVKARAIQALENLKAKLLHIPYNMPSPGFCTLTIASIDLGDSIANKNLNVFGFDLNSRDKDSNQIRAALFGSNDYQKIPDNLIGRTTNYQLAVNIATLWPELIKNKYSKIKFYWNGDSTNMPEVLIQPWKATPKKVIVAAQTINYTPPLIGGDKDFDVKDGNWTSGSVHMEFKIDSTARSLLARVYMQAMEFGGDNTQVKGYSDWRVLYTELDPRFQIQDFTPNVPAEVPFSFTEQGPRDFYPAGTVARYTVQIDQKGDDAGTYTMVTVNLNQLTVSEVQIRP